MSRIQRRFLLGSAWTSVRPLTAADGERHFEVIALPPRHGSAVTLRAILTHRIYQVPIDILEDPAAWRPGWQALDG